MLTMAAGSYGVSSQPTSLWSVYDRRVDPETLRTLIAGLIGAAAGLGGTTLGWGLSARSEDKRLVETRRQAERDAEVGRVVGIVRTLRSDSSTARDLAHGLYLRRGGRVNVSGFDEMREQLNSAIADLNLAASECEVLGPDWIRGELDEFFRVLRVEYLPTAMRLVDQLSADDVRIIQEQIAALDTEHERFTSTAASHVRVAQIGKRSKTVPTARG